MRYLMVLICAVVLNSCQKEEYKVVENQEESSFLLDAQLSAYIKSVASHDGSFDDRVDSAPCFSINFPYGLWIDSVQHQMISSKDLTIIGADAQVVPQFPITITVADYVELDVENLSEFQQYIINCHSGQLYDDIITCIDFNYPISISLYDAENNYFETLVLQHDWDTFNALETIDPDRLVAINYPITLKINGEITRRVFSNEDLKNEILQIIAICN